MIARWLFALLAAVSLVSPAMPQGVRAPKYAKQSDLVAVQALAQQANAAATAAQSVAAVAGPAGPKGDTGNLGPVGPASTIAGPQGAPGAASSIQGPQGPAGATGAAGVDGRSIMGPQGPQGLTGASAKTGHHQPSPDLSGLRARPPQVLVQQVLRGQWARRERRALSQDRQALLERTAVHRLYPGPLDQPGRPARTRPSPDLPGPRGRPAQRRSFQAPPERRVSKGSPGVSGAIAQRVLTISNGAFSGAFAAGTFAATPKIALGWVNTGTLALVCEISSATTTGYAGKCRTISLTAITAVNAGIEVDVLALP